MGYTHYWYREKVINGLKFEAIRKDFQILLPAFVSLGVRLAGGLGEGEPQITSRVIRFNGLRKCGHPKNCEISIPWPADNAGGVASYRESESGQVKTGYWFAGAVVDKRVCDGSCEYETFDFPQQIMPKEWQQSDPKEGGLIFQCTKTAFRPYDLAVTACLVIGKHFLGDKIRVSSDGEMQHWFDAMLLCKMKLGYGMDFKLTKD